MFDRHHRGWAVSRLAGAALVVGLLAAACGSTSTTTASSAGEVVSSAAAAVGSAASAAGSKVSSAASSVGSAASSKLSSAAGAVSSAVAGAVGPAVVGTTTGALGTFLVDGKGMALYMYTPDEAAPGASTCTDACAAIWPPLLSTGAPTVSGTANAAKLSTITRKDGTTQVVYGEYPLYYFAKDKAPGQTTGQGVQGVWYVVGVDGEPIGRPES